MRWEIESILAIYIIAIYNSNISEGCNIFSLKSHCSICSLFFCVIFEQRSPCHSLYCRLVFLLLYLFVVSLHLIVANWSSFCNCKGKDTHVDLVNLAGKWQTLKTRGALNELINSWSGEWEVTLRLRMKYIILIWYIRMISTSPVSMCSSILLQDEKESPFWWGCKWNGVSALLYAAMTGIETTWNDENDHQAQLLKPLDEGSSSISSFQQHEVFSPSKSTCVLLYKLSLYYLMKKMLLHVGGCFSSTI